jgi:mannitol-1-phosphate 5-dehydrogenase
VGVFVQFGAGNIGRSFIGRQFFEAGYEVVFVDIDTQLIDRLNDRHSYPVVVKQSGQADSVLLVEGIRAIDGRDSEAVIAALVSADIVATSVGQRALGAILQVLAQGLVARKQAGRPPLDVIIAENLRAAADFFRQTLAGYLPADFALSSAVGLVETSIGKMVPIMPQSALAADPLQLFAEPYDQLIVDARGFLNPLPRLSGLKPVANVTAYVDRKLFMHNMSHAALAYLGYQADPDLRYLWQVMELPAVVEQVRVALGESAEALCRVYQDDFTRLQLDEHAADLLRRYANQALGDTIYRVGRDLRRKLAHDDRLVGACLLAARQGLPFSRIALAARAALGFRALDEQGRMSVADAEFLSGIESQGSRQTLSLAAGLNPDDPLERRVLDAVSGG